MLPLLLLLSSAPPLSEEAKQAMLLEAVQELCGGYIEICRRRLQDDDVGPDVLLASLGQLVSAIEELRATLPPSTATSVPSGSVDV